MKKITCFALSVFALFSTKAFSSATETSTSEEYTGHLSKASVCFDGLGYTTKQLLAIENHLSSREEREIPMINSPQERDFGYDFPKSSSFNLMLLLAIRTYSYIQPTTTHPICYDIGGGYGGDSRNMVLAGGKVTYIEQHPDVAATARKEVYTALREIASDQDQKKELWSRLRMIKGDFLQTKSTVLYPETLQINFCNLSNVLHFLTPSQIEAFLPALFKKMATDGLVFASMHVPCDSEKVVDYFLDQKEKGNPYPGYFRYVRYCNVKKTSKNEMFLNFQENKKLTDAEPALEGDLPGQTTSQTFFPTPPSHPKTVTIKTVIHYFDPDIGRAAFERAGFTVQKSFFTSPFGEPLESQKATRKALLTGNYHLTVIATKSK